LAHSNLSIITLSGGLDSVVNLYEAFRCSKVVLALTFDYGQRSFRKECAAASYFCEQLNVPHQIIELEWLSRITTSALVNRSAPLPTSVDLENHLATAESAKAVWVPNRNGVFINIAASFAEAMGAGWIVVGWNKEEAATFSDNSGEFVNASNQFLELSTQTQPTIQCWTIEMDKTQILSRALELGIDINNIWPCYESNDELCGVCESCQRFLRAKMASST